MKVNLGTIEVDDDVRRAMKKNAGEPGLATRDEVKAWADGLVDAGLSTVMREAFGGHFDSAVPKDSD